MEGLSIFAIAGHMGTGKATATRFLVEKFGYTKLTFTGPIKDVVAAATGWPRDRLEGATPEDREWREDPANIKYGRTPRQWLQFVGTELFRQQVDDNIWVDRMETEIHTLYEKGVRKIVVSDLQYPDEVQLMQKLGAVIIHLTAPGVASNFIHLSSERDPESSLKDVIRLHNNMNQQFFDILREIVAQKTGLRLYDWSH